MGEDVFNGGDGGIYGTAPRPWALFDCSFSESGQLHALPVIEEWEEEEGNDEQNKEENTTTPRIMLLKNMLSVSCPLKTFKAERGGEKRGL